MRRLPIIVSFVIIAFLVLILSLIASTILLDQGNVQISTQSFVSDSGITTYGKLYYPNSWATSPSKPAVILLHPFGGNKQTQVSFSIEFARRGYLALNLDLRSHGDSEGSYSTIIQSQVPMKDDIEAALSFLRSQGAEQFGIIGHSHGAGIALMVANTNPNISAVTILGNAFLEPNAFMPPEEYLHVNATSPSNLLFAVGELDEIVPVDYARRYFATTIDPSIGDNFEIGRTYGDFADGSARKFVLTSSTHMIESIDPIIVRESVDWMRQSLIIGKNLPDPVTWIDPFDQTSTMFQVLLFFITLLVLGLLIPLSMVIGTYKDLLFPSSDIVSKATGSLFFTIMFPLFLISFAVGVIGIFLGFAFPPAILGTTFTVWFLSSAAAFLIIFNKDDQNTILEVIRKIINEITDEVKAIFNNPTSYFENHKKAFFG
ncbi:MAG: alpha/beta hydrolase, partial [Candidatus Hodarchaeota archaeon]